MKRSFNSRYYLFIQTIAQHQYLQRVITICNHLLIMKKKSHHIFLLILLFFSYFSSQANTEVFLTKEISKDTLKTEKNRKAKREQEKEDLRNSHARLKIKVDNVFAKLDTRATFQFDDGIFNVSLGLEDNFGLPNNKNFFTGSIYYRFTPRSGIYTRYYGINREKTIHTDQDYYFLDQMIPAGSTITSYFNTQVISTGYLLSIIKEPDTFLGFYFNLYIMRLETGVKSDTDGINKKVDVLAPLPNLGLIIAYNLTNWLSLEGDIGFFSLHTQDYGGSLYSLDVSLILHPIHWLGLNLGYKEFDINFFFPEGNVNTIIDYNFKGPSLGLSFVF